MEVEVGRTQKRQQNKAVNSRHTSIPSAQSAGTPFAGAAAQALPGTGPQPALVCQAGLLAPGDSTTQPLPVVLQAGTYRAQQTMGQPPRGPRRSGSSASATRTQPVLPSPAVAPLPWSRIAPTPNGRV